MARKPEPWYWAARKCWYVQINHKQIKLDPDAKKARALWHRLMASTGGLEPKEKLGLTVPEVADLFIESRVGRRGATIYIYEQLLVPWAASQARRKLADVRMADVVAYCNSKTWAPGTKRGLYRQIVTLLRWARDAGYLEFNPLAGSVCPWPRADKRRPMTREEYLKVLEATRQPEFRLLIRVLWSSGCRPGEAYGLCAKHLHPTLPVATLTPDEHKTGGRTGKNRQVVLPKAVMDDLRKQAEKYPEGPLLRNRLGRKWTTQSLHHRFKKLRKSLGLPDHVVPYSARHGMATDLVSANPTQSASLLAKIMGHANSDTFEAIYYHPEMLAMIEAVERTRGEATNQAPPAADDSGSQSAAAPPAEPPETPGSPAP
jgi:integrase